MVPGKHGRIQYEKYKKAGKRFPVAIVVGGDPLGYLISGIEIPFGVRVELRRGDLESAGLGGPRQTDRSAFPAASEIVLEGFVEPNDERAEGRSASSTVTTRARPGRRQR